MIPATIGIVGAGWRAEYFLRIARHLPERFSVAGVLARSQASVERVERDWSVPATTSIADFLAARYDYVVVSVPREEVAGLTATLVAADIPVLLETPPAGDLPGLIALWNSVGGAPVQVAEQYHLQPQHAARLAVAASGALGPVRRASISVAHGYHAISLLRFALGVGFAPAEVRAQVEVDRVLAARGRDGWLATAARVDDIRTAARLDFGTDDAGVPRTGTVDFGNEQYVSPIRGRHVTLHGETGELHDDTVTTLIAGADGGPHHVALQTLRREATGVDGDLDGRYLRSITLGTTAVWENRFGSARLNDDELAGAAVMLRMAEYGEGGRPFYGLADASHDHYLSLLIDESARSGQTVRSAVQPWSTQQSATTHSTSQHSSP